MIYILVVRSIKLHSNNNGNKHKWGHATEFSYIFTSVVRRRAYNDLQHKIFTIIPSRLTEWKFVEL